MEIVRILGIDPGLRFTGYGIVNYDTEKNEIWTTHCGLIKTPQKIKGISAILYMIEKIEELSLNEFIGDCDKIVIEMPAAVYSAKFSSGALLPVAAVAGGSFSIFDSEKLVPVYPSVWNQRMKKEKTKAITESILGETDTWTYDYKPKAKPQFEHIVDGISMALWYMKLNYIEE